nr:MAG TPA: hypothetical protein [Caudoviricetes sp.]
MAGNFVPPTPSSTLGTSSNRWAGGFFDKLAVKTLEVIGGGTENNAQPATVGWVKTAMGDILGGVLPKLGVRYNFDANGYVCFGSLFGNFVIQWGTALTDAGTGKVKVALPVEVARNLTMVATVNSADVPTSFAAVDIGSMTISAAKTSGTPYGATVRWLHLGRA